MKEKQNKILDKINQIKTLTKKYQIKSKTQKLAKKVLPLLNRKFKISAMLAVMGVAPLAFLYVLSYTIDYYILIGPFCATSALIISKPHSEVCKTRKIFGGYMIAVFTIIALSGISESLGLIAFILVFSITVFLMNYFNLFHPPATAITIVDLFIASHPIKMLIYAFIASIIMCYFAYLYRKIHERVIDKIINI